MANETIEVPNIEIQLHDESPAAPKRPHLRQLRRAYEKATGDAVAPALQAYNDALAVAQNDPRAIAACDQAALDRLQRENARASVQKDTDAVSARHNLQFVDIAPHPKLGTPGMTVAFARVKRSSNRYHVSTALRNPKDPYDRLFGRYTAALNFHSLYSITVSIPKGVAPKAYLRNMFAW